MDGRDCGMSQRLSVSRVLLSVVAGCAITLPALIAAPGDEIDRVRFPDVSPQDMTWEPNTETYYVTTFIGGEILQLSPDFSFILSELTSPFDANEFLTGIAYDCINDTFWIAQPQLREIAEIYRPNPESENPNIQNGGPTGRRIQPDFLPVVNPASQPAPRGMAFDHNGDGGTGTLWIVESLGTVIYEVNLDGEIMRSFVHPDDPDGHPGDGASAQSSDIQLIYNEAGDSVDGFYITAFDREAGKETLRRLDSDGNYTGFSIPLDSGGGNIAAFIHGPVKWGNPAQTIDPAVIVLVDSKAEVVVLDGEEPELPEILTLECNETGNDVQLSWTSFTTYDQVEIHRNSTVVATIAGDAVEFTDTVMTPGTYDYQVFAETGSFRTSTALCRVVIGPGQVLESFEFAGEWPADLTVDIDNRIAVTDFTGRSIWIYDSDWSEILTLDGSLGDIEPFQSEGDLLTGIAAHSDRVSYFVYNADTRMIAEIDGGGFSVPGTTPFEVPLPGFADDPEREADPIVIGMDYCPSGNGGQGSLWLGELRDNMIHEIDLQGNVIGGFRHPDHLPELPADLTNVSNGGLAFVRGSDCQLLDVTGGRFLEFGNTRILRMTSSGELQNGCIVPLDGAIEECPTGLYGIAPPRDGSQIFHTIAIANGEGCLMNINAAPFELKPLTDLTCAQEGLENTVGLSFSNNDTYDVVEVYRDSTKIADLPGNATEFVDTDLPAAAYHYEIRATAGLLTTAFLSCTLRVGAGAILDSQALDVPTPNQITHDPCDGSYFLSSTAGREQNNLYHVDENFDLIEVFEDVLVQFPTPFDIATLAVRGSPDCSLREIYIIGWDTAASLVVDQEFTLEVYSVTGERLRTIEFDPPHPDNGFVTHPVGLTWDPETDTFYFFERNSLIVTQFDPFGNFLNQFTHPQPPLRSFVFSVGLTADPQTQGLLSTTADAKDRGITRIIEITPNGGITGTVIPLTEIEVASIRGITLLGSELKVLAGRGGLSFAYTLEAYDPIPQPKSFKANKSGNKAVVDLDWTNEATYDQLLMFRDGNLIETLPGNATSYTDNNAEDGFQTYALRGQVGTDVGRAAIFELTTLVAFKRADVDGSGTVDITDPLLNLSFQFLGDFDPSCMDALDTDDSGQIDITDPLSSLTFQFLGAFIIPPPGPMTCGGDPSSDGLNELGCESYDNCGP